jgi:hypothetical protein
VDKVESIAHRGDSVYRNVPTRTWQCHFARETRRFVRKRLAMSPSVTQRVRDISPARRMGIAGTMEGDNSMIEELAGAALVGIIENLPTALIMAGLAAAAALIARRRARKNKDDRTP